MSVIESKLLDYLKVQIPGFSTKTAGSMLFCTCPKCNTPGSGNIPKFTHVLQCAKCGRVGNIYELVRLVEPDKVSWSVAQIDSYINQLLKLGITTSDEISKAMGHYQSCGFDMTPVVRNGRAAFEKDWPNISHKDPSQWMQWLDGGLNIGVKTGRCSKIIVVDADNPALPPDVKKLFDGYVGMHQITTNGHHYFYLYTDEIPNCCFDYEPNTPNHVHFDIRSDGGQVVVFPSVVDGHSRKFDDWSAIPPMPQALKDFIIKHTGGLKKATEPNVPAAMPTFDESQIQLVGEGNRNNFLIHFGGILRKTLNSQQTTDVLSVVNAKFISPPLPRHEFNTLVGSLDKYIKHEAKDLAVKILEYLRTVGEATARDIKEVAGESKEKVDKALAWLVKEGAVIKHRRMFQVVRKADWQESLDASNNRVGFNVPYFYDIAEFNWGDMILLGSKTKWGKTTIAMNIIEQLVRQGVKPYYISSESGSRFGQTAKLLSMKAGDFKWVSMSDATKIELEPNAITIIDWLMIEDKSQTDVVLKHFTDQLVKTNGVLFIFMQLREDNGLWFAQNMAKQYPSLAARYLYDDEKDGSKGKWVVDAIREPKGAVKSSIIPCVYVHKDRRLTRIQANPGGSII